MLVGKDINNKSVLGWKAEKNESYYCPNCNEELILKKGDVKVHHFAHVRENGCSYGSGESAEHLQMKKVLYDKFSRNPFYKEIKLEQRIGERIGDVYLRDKRDKQIVIECQVSPIDLREFKKRTAYYSYKGIYLIWIFSNNENLDKRLIKLIHTYGSRLCFSPSDILNKCHYWFYGRIYYFYNNKIYAIHFHPFERWILSSCDECLEQASCPYTNPKDCPKYRPGYLKKSKTKREISLYPIIQTRLKSIDRKDKIKIAKFKEPAWWKV